MPKDLVRKTFNWSAWAYLCFHILAALELKDVRRDVEYREEKAVE